MGFTNALAPDVVEQIRQAYADGEDRVAIAERFGVTRSTVWKRTYDIVRAAEPEPPKPVVVAKPLFPIALPIPDPQTWEDQAACRDADPELFFPEPGEHGRLEEARRYCNRCPVRLDCGSYALDNRLIGVWGGLSDIQRGRLLAKRDAASTKEPAA